MGGSKADYDKPLWLLSSREGARGLSRLRSSYRADEQRHAA
jgi:hypothetical protein